MLTGTYNPRVLVVDDDPAICAILCLKLGDEGCDCESAQSGEAGLAKLRHESFDIILSDLYMPGMSGLDFMQEALRVRPNAAFLLVTGEHDVQIGIEAMKRGASDYVVKPFKLDAALHSVMQALDKKRLQLEVESYRSKLEEMVDARTRQLFGALREIESTYDETLQALGAALDLRDAATAGHSNRVTHYAVRVAEIIGSSGEQLREITRGAYLHDIGKIGIPDRILLKESRLTQEEETAMRAHVLIGYQLVSRIPFLTPSAAIVRAHHERYDGAGYPDRTRGPEIPIGARVFAVADTFDAMTSDRPYRRSLPFETAFEEIRSQSGRQFDPDVVSAFLSAPAAVWQGIQRDSFASGGIYTSPNRMHPAPAGV